VAVLLWSAVLRGHEVRPGYLEITEEPSGAVRVLWKQPVMGELAVPMQPSLSSGWLEKHPPRLTKTESFVVRRWDIPAGAGALAGQTVTILGLEATFTDVLVRVQRPGAETVTRLLKPSLL
jgi:hypothetical protein